MGYFVNKKKRAYCWIAAIAGLMVAGEVMAGGGGGYQTLGGMASTITLSFRSLAKLMTASSYLAGIGFSLGAILKFKQHKDNPTQIPIGTPIALVFIGAALLFLPTVLGIAGQTMFGPQGQTAGPSGAVFQFGNTK